jgi:hypothetical protein
MLWRIWMIVLEPKGWEPRSCYDLFYRAGSHSVVELLAVTSKLQDQRSVVSLTRSVLATRARAAVASPSSSWIGALRISTLIAAESLTLF